MAEDARVILMLGCFDTKAEEFSYLRERLLALGDQVLSMNVGVLGSTERFPVELSAQRVAEAAGLDLQEVQQLSERGEALQVMGDGARKLIERLLGEGRIKAVVGMGGGGGTYLALRAMQALPFGMPKLCISTLAGKDLSRQMAQRDIVLMPSIVDVAGLNSILRSVIRQGAAAISGMARQSIDADLPFKGRLAISIFGNTTPCVNACRDILQQAGYEVFTFHANGLGGKSMESLIRRGYFDGLLDVTTTELADELFGGVCSAGPERLSAAAENGIPQVVVPGCLDMVNFASREEVPGRYAGRLLHKWAPDVTLMRTDVEENRALARLFTDKLNRSKGPCIVLLPLQGLSAIDKAGSSFYDSQSNQTLFSEIRRLSGENIQLRSLDMHINDTAFSAALAEALLSLLEPPKSRDTASAYQLV